MKKDHQEDRDAYVDKAGRAILRAVSASDKEIESALASPFLYPRIRARMNQSAKQTSMPFYQSLLMVSVVRHAIPILALIAILAVCSYNFTGKRALPQTPFGDESAYLPISDPNTPVTACSITSRTECVVSTDDALALLVNVKERQQQK